jgi:hypothetical protein
VANNLIHESRRLQFPLDTLVDALIELENKQGQWPPKTTVVGASIDNSGTNEAGVILSIHRAEGGEVIERRYSLSKLAAAMVNYCLTMRVPIPRNSTKSIQFVGDGVTLLLENTVILQTRHEALSTLPAGSVKPPAAPADEQEIPPTTGPEAAAAAENDAAAPSAPATETAADDAATAGENPPAAQAPPAGDAKPSE